MKLYKYYPENIYSFKSLSVKGLWCHHPKNMNDPFECLGYLNRKVPKIDIDNFRLVHKFTNNPRLKKIVLLNDYQFVEFLNTQRKTFINQFAFCSLSQMWDDILMWSHYSSDHKGFVVEFDFDDNQLEKDFYKVEYKNELPAFNIDLISEIITGKFDNKRKLIEDISIKTEDWEKEKEIRIWRSKPGYYFYEIENLKRIIFGVNCEAETKHLVMNILSEFSEDVDVVEMKFDVNPIKLKYN